MPALTLGALSEAVAPQPSVDVDKLCKEHFEAKGRTEMRVWMNRLTQQLMSAPDTSENPFAILLQRLLREHHMGFDAISILCGGDGVRKYQELREHEAAVTQRSLAAVGDEWDKAVYHILWCVVGPATQRWYRMVHTPEGLLGDSTVLTKAARMTPGQVRAKNDLLRLWAAQAKSGDDTLEMVREMHVGGDVSRACPYVEVEVVGSRGSDSSMHADAPFPCDYKRAPVLACRRRLVGYQDVLRPENGLSPGFAAAMVRCDHEQEFILVVRRKGKEAVFVVARDLVMMDPDAAKGSVQTHVNSEH